MGRSITKIEENKDCSVLVPIQPRGCQLIASGEETIEIRTTRPSINTPVKCYIYCTRPKTHFGVGGGLYFSSDDLYRLPNGTIKYGSSIELMSCAEQDITEDNFLNGKVIGEFICDEILSWRRIGYTGSKEVPTYKLGVNLAMTGLSYDELEAYAKGKEVFGWHISNLIIYNRPLSLAQFAKRSLMKDEAGKITLDWSCPISRAPQSWCYTKRIETCEDK